MEGCDGVEQIVSVDVMRESDRLSIAALKDKRTLMRRAGQAVFESHAWKGPTAIVCGTGNNAGDGYVLAKHLQESGVSVRLFLADERFSQDGAYFFAQCREAGIAYSIWNGEDLSPYCEIADCLLGTGFSGVPRGKIGEMIDAVNAAKDKGAFVLSVDINSGLNGDTGLCEKAVRSDLTVSIGYYKTGHFLNQAKDLIGRKINCNIGIALHGESICYPDPADFSPYLQQRPHFSHKGMWGYVTVMGGCLSYSGAAKLANLSASALRCGCGVVRLAVPDCLKNAVLPYLLESTLCVMPDRDGHMIFDEKALQEAFGGIRAAAVGMGWGSGAEYADILDWILRTQCITLIIDADGINTLAKMDLSILRQTACRVILTPHLKEFERLSGVPLEEIQKEPLRVAQEFAAAYHVILLLKGTATVVTDGTETYLCDRGCAGMATAGSGDVLSGVLCGLMGYCPPTAGAVCMGAWLAGRAGELAQAQSNAVSMTAGDTVSMLPQAVGELLKQSANGEREEQG